MSIFQKLRAKQEDHLDRKPADQLMKGIKYPVHKFRQRKSDFPDRKTGEYPMNLVAHITDRDSSYQMKYYVIMPAVYNNLSETEVAELNSVIDNGETPHIVFYGKEGSRNEVDLLEPGKDVDQSKLARYLKMEEPGTEPTNAKKPRLDDSLGSSSSS